MTTVTRQWEILTGIDLKLGKQRGTERCNARDGERERRRVFNVLIDTTRVYRRACAPKVF